MEEGRKRTWKAFVFLCAFALTGASARAQDWKPGKTIEIVIGLTAGSSQDRTGRALQKVWQETNATAVGVNVVNRPGGGGQVAWAYLAQHAGDPHFLQIASPTLLARYITGLGTFQFTDFTPLALLGSQYLGAAVRPDSPVKTARDLMERLKREPYSLSLGINSAGGTLHIMAGLLVKGAGGDPRKARIAVFQGGELMTAGIGGHVDAIVTVASNILPHVESGKLTMLGVAAPARLAGALASVPTFREQGIDLVVRNWAGVFAAKGLSPQQIAFWDGVLAATVATPAWKAFVAANQWEPEYLNSAEYVKHLHAEDARLRSALTALGLARR
jgi:putative tricarboxylic transport membrane protein